MKRILIVLGSILAASVVLYGAGMALLVYGLAQSDPYPTFMSDYRLKGTPSYVDAERSFSDFTVKRFPSGSDAEDAIAQITRGGFQIISSGSDSTELLWKRQAGPVASYISLLSARTLMEPSLK